MARIPLIEKSEASAEVLQYYDRIAAWLAPQPGERARRGVERPPQIWRAYAHNPKLGQILFEGSSYILSQLPWAQAHLRERQFVIMTVMRRLNCDWAYRGHWGLCEKAGIDRALYDQFATMQGVEAAKTSPDFTEEERQLITYADDLTHTGNVSDALFSALEKRYGPQGMVELTALIGYRMLTSVFINAIGIGEDF